MRRLNNKGFSVSSILYPILILTVFLIVQVLTMMASRKTVLDKNKQQLLDSVNASNKIYTIEELSILVSNLQEENQMLKTKLDKTNAIVNTLASDSGWNTLVSGIEYRKIGSLVFIMFDSHYTIPGSGWQTIGTLPKEYWPSKTSYGASIAYNGTTGNDIMSYVTSTGILKVYTDKSRDLVGMFVYPVG